MIAHRAQEIPPFLVMDVLERAQELERQGHRVIHLEVGEPDFTVPAAVREAACQAVREGYTHYTHSLGDAELRQAICDDYYSRYGITIEHDRVLVTSGTSPAMLLLFGALLDPGDEVILFDPGYACYPNFVRFVGGEPIRVPVFEEDGFQFCPNAIEERLGPRTKAILINSPSNPTGTLLSDQSMQSVAGMAPYVVSDEIYHGLVYEGRERTILEFTDRAFVLNGFSKLYAMTGMRLGYLIAPADFVRPLQKLQQNLFICASSVAQRAALAAVSSPLPEVAEMKATYDRRRRYMISRLRELGFRIAVVPTGAFYVFVNASHLSEDSHALAFDILDRAHLGVTPGIDFGPHGEGYLRFSYASSMENIKEGMARLERYLATR